MEHREVEGRGWADWPNPRAMGTHSASQELQEEKPEECVCVCVCGFPEKPEECVCVAFLKNQRSVCVCVCVCVCVAFLKHSCFLSGRDFFIFVNGSFSLGPNAVGWTHRGG